MKQVKERIEVATIKHKLAAQMYSLRKELAADPEQTFQRLKEIGFEAIQLDGMRGHDPELINRLVKKHSFKIAGMHIKHDRFMDDLDGIVEEAYLFGCKTIYDKYIEDDEQHLEGYQKTKAVLIKAARTLAPLGFRVGLHCPEYDYNQLIAGRKVLEYITDPVDGTLVYAEPDTYWMTVAGTDPVEEIKQYSRRAPIIHLKDCVADCRDQDEQHNMTEIGSGVIDMVSIIRWGEANVTEYYCIEQDHSSIGMLASMEKSFNYLAQLEV